jgi:uncharacterized protein
LTRNVVPSIGRGAFLAARLPTACLLLAGLLTGCGGPAMEKVPGPGSVVELTVGGKRISVELATDDPSRQRGLMFRKEMPEDRGMLFIWPERGRNGQAGRRRQAFWMRNTEIPLSIAFIDDEGKVLEIVDMEPHDERQRQSKDEVRYALEMNQGWFRKNGLGPGAVFDGFREKMRGIEAR